MRYKLDVYLPDGAAHQFTADDWIVTESQGLEVFCGGTVIAFFAPCHWARVISHEPVRRENEA